jgi:4-carboxymuconolactone decarboxylase
VARLEPPKMEELTEEQKAIYAAITRSRPRVSGPFGVWLRIPPIADAANKLVNSIRDTGKIDKRLYEFIVMIVAAHWTASYAWAAHEQTAKDVGIAPDVIEAIRTGKKPNFTKQDEAIIYDAVTSLLRNRKLGDDTYQALLKMFGLDMTIEIISVAGIYSMIATVINGFEVPTPNGEKPFA